MRIKAQHPGFSDHYSSPSFKSAIGGVNINLVQIWGLVVGFFSLGLYKVFCFQSSYSKTRFILSWKSKISSSITACSIFHTPEERE